MPRILKYKSRKYAILSFSWFDKMTRIICHFLTFMPYMCYYRIRKEILIMGFYLTEPCQIRLQVPHISYEIILNDIIDFMNVPEKEQISSFLNKIIKNFYLEADSTIAEKKWEIHQKYLFWTEDFKESDKITEILTKKILEERKSTITTKYSYPKKETGQSIRFIPNKTIKDLLKNSPENTIYGDNISKYLSALIQEYTDLPREKREIIFFKDIYLKMENCIKNHHKAEVKLYNQEVYLIRPCQITTNGTSPWNYVVSFAHKKQENTEDRLISLRLQRIESVDERQTFTFQHSEQEQIHKVLKNPSQISYLAGEREKIIVRLTQNGINLYKHIILTNRPKCINPDCINKKTESDSIYLKFDCTPEQIYQYFIKFGKDAEIIEPLELRERFAEIHRTAVEYYYND